MLDKGISQAVIRRMPRYYRYLGELMEEGVERISSNELSERMKVTASQIRQDLNNFGGFGQQGYGYHVSSLYEEIGKILGLNHTHNLVIVGAGHLGQAIANYSKFEKLGFLLVALFDIDPKLIGASVRGAPILSMESLPSFAAAHSIDIAALTMPKDSAVEAATLLAENGVHAIWNFAHVDLDIPGVVVENVHLSDSIMRLSYSMTENE